MLSFPGWILLEHFCLFVSCLDLPILRVHSSLRMCKRKQVLTTVEKARRSISYHLTKTQDQRVRYPHMRTARCTFTKSADTTLLAP